MNKYKAIGFDHTGVIVGIPASEFHKRVSEILGVSIEEFENAYLSHNTAFNSGEITMEELWKRILNDLGKAELYQEIINFSKEPRKLNLEIVSFIKELKAKGYKLGLLTNDSKEASEPIKNTEHLEELFDVTCLSAETGLFKPNRDAYEDFMKKLGVTPGELIYIDDSERIVKGAKELGIETIWVLDQNEIRNQLKEKGV